jgi:hypothetical protein
VGEGAGTDSGQPPASERRVYGDTQANTVGAIGDALKDAPRRLAPFHCALIGQGFALVQEQRFNQPFGNYVAQ